MSAPSWLLVPPQNGARTAILTTPVDTRIPYTNILCLYQSHTYTKFRVFHRLVFGLFCRLRTSDKVQQNGECSGTTPKPPIRGGGWVWVGDEGW